MGIDDRIRTVGLRHCAGTEDRTSESEGENCLVHVALLEEVRPPMRRSGRETRMPLHLECVHGRGRVEFPLVERPEL
jgi:hypothetical protein